MSHISYGSNHSKVMSCCCKRGKHAAEIESMDRSSGVVSSMEGGRAALYADLTSSKQSVEMDGIVYGRRESLYSDLESLKQSSAIVVDGQWASLSPI